MDGWRDMDGRLIGHGGVRIGHAERERAVASLGEHFAAGRLDADEYADRVGTAFAARTEDDLTPLFADLPSARPVPPADTGRRRWPDERMPIRLVLGVLVVVACIAWVAVLHVPPFFLFPLVWFTVARGGRRRYRR